MNDLLFWDNQEDTPKPGQPGQAPRPAGPGAAAAAAPRVWSLQAELSVLFSYVLVTSLRMFVSV